MNWFSATPSASASLRASSNSDFCSRSAKLLLLIRLLQLPKRLAGRTDSQISKSELLEIPLVESDQHIRPAIQRGFKYHVVVRVSQHRPPAKVGHNRFRYTGNRIKQLDDLRGLQPRGSQMLFSSEHRLVF